MAQQWGHSTKQSWEWSTAILWYFMDQTFSPSP
jgi:hypothetical protein